MAQNGKKPQNGTAKPLCFVIGPIGKDNSSERKHADMLLNAVVKHALEAEEFGYKVKRADEDADPGMIGDRVITDIIHAPLVIADLTDLNPNAFYELGIRHSTELPTIHLARTATQLPFDNIAHRTIFVDLTDWHSIEQARARLADSARAINAPDYRVSNPITQANASFKMRQSEDPRDQIIAEMQERMSNLESVAAQEPQIETAWDMEQRFKFFIDNGQKLEAIKIYKDAVKCDLRSAKDFVEALLGRRPIDATRLHRGATGLGLKEAKEVVDRLMP